jgi:hypothetical protein
LTAPASADANGDNAVDVRDMQAVVAAVLAGDTSRIADVNRDGQVDVRDLQVIVAAVERAEPAEPAPAEELPQAVLPGAVPVVTLPVNTPSLVRAPEAPAPRIVVAARETGFFLPEQWRYTLCMTPHAPPSLG